MVRIYLHVLLDVFDVSSFLRFEVFFHVFCTLEVGCWSASFWCLRLLRRQGSALWHFDHEGCSLLVAVRLLVPVSSLWTHSPLSLARFGVAGPLGMSTFVDVLKVQDQFLLAVEVLTVAGRRN